MKKRSLLLLPLAFSTAVIAAEPDARAEREIEQLRGFIQRSSCDFNRNGSWHAASEAAEHIGNKYDYVRGKGLVGSAEDFIARAATESSITGRPYRVRCGDRVLTSEQWLRDELARLRAASSGQPSPAPRP